MQVETTGPAPGFQSHPSYAIETEALEGPVRVAFAGDVIAETDGAIWLHETKHFPVLYVPRADVLFELLTETALTTYCPFKGDARYWSIKGAGAEGENAVWGYDAPFDEVSDLVRYVAFYGDRVDITVAGKTIPRQGPGYTDA
jgi:uncharacterized protein (DUF427 family)